MAQRNALYFMLLGVVAAVGGAMRCLGYALDGDALWKLMVQGGVVIGGLAFATIGYRAWSKPNRGD